MQSTLNKIAIEKNTLPQYISIDQKEFIKDFLKGKKLKDINLDVSFLKKFKNITRKDLGILWIFFNYSETLTTSIVSVSDEDLKIIREKFDESLTTKTNIKEHLKTFKENFDKNFKDLKENFEEYEKINEKIKILSVEKVPLLTITDIYKDYTLSLKNNETLIDVFNDMKVSITIPFIFLSFEGKKYFKVYEPFKNIPKEWATEKILDSQENNYLLIKLLKNSQGKTKISNYTNVIWDVNNVLTVDVSHLLDNENTIIKNIENSFEDIKIKLLQEEENNIRGDFIIENIKNFEKHIFLDMIMNEQPFSQLLFVDESSPKTTLQKNRMTVYYYPNKIKSIEHAVSMTVDKTSRGVEVHLSRIKNKEIAKDFILLFCKILILYEKKYKDIKKIYDELLPHLKDVKLPQEDLNAPKESDKKIYDLYKHDPKLFIRGYYARDLCQAIKQPIIVDEKQAKKIIKEKGKDYIMEFPTGSKIFYTSDGMNKFKFPGLKSNNATKTKKKFKDEKERQEEIEILKKHEEEYPCIPCCFEISQYEKKSSKLRKYMETGNCDSKKTKKNITYVKQISDKALEEGEDGELTPTLKGIYTTSSGAFKRRGVADSPNSFLHCVEMAVNTGKYLSSNDKEEYTRDARKKLLTEHSKELAILKQEFYSFTTKQIGEKIADVNSYFDPNFFIRLIEHVYKVNVFIYVVEQKNLNGEVSLPNSYNNYIMKMIDTTKPTIVIIKYENLNLEWPYRCEIVKNSMKKDGKNISSFLLTDEEIIKKHAEILYFNNSQKIIINSTVIDFPPQKETPLLSKAVSQYIDVDGKVYALKFSDKIVLQTNPCPPLPIEQSREKKEPIEAIDEKDALEFIKNNNLKILGITKTNDLYVKSKSFMYCFIHIKGHPEGVKKIKGMILYNNVSNFEKSALDDMIKNRKIAHYLKEYALYVYANKNKIDVNDFLIKKDHSYKTFSNNFENNKDFYSDKKIIVKDKNIINLLINYVKVKKLNIINLEEKYKNKTSIFNSYDFITDFKHRAEQLIFLSSKEALYHIEKEDIETTNISNILNVHKKYAYYYSSYKLNDGKVCIVQNVEGGEKERALYVANEWKNHNINVGFDAPRFGENEVSNVVIFKEPFDENKKIGDINILQTEGGEYCALLFFKE